MNRVLRGGSYLDDVSRDLPTSIRFRYVPENRFWNIGFRIVVSKKRSRQ